MSLSVQSFASQHDETAERDADIDGMLDQLENILRRRTLDLKQDKEDATASSHDILTRFRTFTTQFTQKERYLSSPHCISVLGRYGFSSGSPDRILALRCLCNILFQGNSTRRIFIELQFPREAMKLLKTTDPEYEFVSARLLLLCTYQADLDVGPLFEESNVAETINTNIFRYTIDTSGAHVVVAGNEVLKLCSCLLARYPPLIPHFARSLNPILIMLRGVNIMSPPLQPPMSLLINCLVFLELDAELVFPSSDPTVHIDRLVNVLDRSLLQHDESPIVDEMLSPLLQVLLRVAEIATGEPRSRFKKLFQASLYDRNSPLGTGSSLQARLLRTSNTIGMGALKILTSSLLFELSDKDTQEFIRNVGYGYASGFLFSKGIHPSPSNMSHSRIVDEETSETIEVNPVTGQRLDREPGLPIHMSDEEKEREAGRLFVLFERLRANGAINVENPVAVAARQGQLE